MVAIKAIGRESEDFGCQASGMAQTGSQSPVCKRFGHED